METADDKTENTTLSPDDAFSVLGDETRMRILQTLGKADEPLSFSELRDRVDMRDSGRFNYHLKKLEGHFIRKTDDGYGLRQAGNRVIEAVLSGAVTDDPVVELTRIDQSCPYCGASVEVGFREERVQIFCPNCAGTYRRLDSPQKLDAPAEYGHIGDILLPPAGIVNRTPDEMTRAAFTWANLEFAAGASGVCPRCSARFEQSVEVCESHDPGDGLCDDCGRRHAVHIRNRCTNCNYGHSGTASLAILDNIDFQAFLIDHGINPMAPSPERYFAIESAYEEELLSTDPFKARFMFSIDGDTLNLTIDEDLNVVDVSRHDASGSA
ncbi:MAG: helix-turn-helix domain-containing protein [Halobacteria archaeon]|nr:helix-turn-helix domain-containing protein [Halobacteria archaeon]